MREHCEEKSRNRGETVDHEERQLNPTPVFDGQRIRNAVVILQVRHTYIWTTLSRVSVKVPDLFADNFDKFIDRFVDLLVLFGVKPLEGKTGLPARASGFAMNSDLVDRSMRPFCRKNVQTR